MRKIFLLVLITTVLLAVSMVPAQAAEAIISTNLYGVMTASEVLEIDGFQVGIGDLNTNPGLYNVAYEGAVGDTMSLFVGAGFGSWLTQINAGANYYVMGKALEGLYVGGNISLDILNLGIFSVTGFGFAGNVGYKLNLGSIVIDPFIGYGSVSIFGITLFSGMQYGINAGFVL